jgi:KUP system potassium uptake protein
MFALGAMNLAANPGILMAVNPFYAVKFLPSTA